MPIEVVVPRSGWSMEEGTFAGWLKRDGEEVKAGDRLFALESDKAVEEAESMDAGTLYIPPGAPKSGDRVKVGQVLGYLLGPGEAKPAGGPAAPAAPADLAKAGGVPAGRAPTELGPDIGGDLPPAATASAPPSGSVPVTPRARRAAKENQVNLAAVSGTGRGGRIRERDVLRQAAAAAPAPPSGRSPQPAGAEATEARQMAEAARERETPGFLPITSLRRMIAERMKRSQAETAPVTLTTRADATNLVALRNQFKAAAGDPPSSPVPAYTDFIAKLTALALQRHPALGGRWEGDRILLPTAMHLGLAVDTEAGLLVPVIRNVDSLPLQELARRSRELIGAAQRRQIKAEDLQGGVFTLTNLGAFGIDAFTPIINYPETAILGLGAIRREAVVLPDGHLGARDLITLSLTFDHRVVDGAPAARFLQHLAQGIENPAAWLLG